MKNAWNGRTKSHPDRTLIEKIIHVIIFALISILVNIVILYSIPVKGDDIWIVLYFFYSSIISTIISAVIYLIIYKSQVQT